jgi:putative toxin-antitoxin system antitoxin component (TIGR02293 family)
MPVKNKYGISSLLLKSHSLDKRRELQVQYQMIESVSRYTGINIMNLLKLLNMSEQTYYRNKREKRLLDLAKTYFLIRLVELYEYGKSVFSDESLFLEWLNNSSPALQNHKPIDFLNTPLGIDQVREEIDRLEYSIY